MSSVKRRMKLNGVDVVTAPSFRFSSSAPVVASFLSSCMTLSFHSYSRGRSPAAFGPLGEAAKINCNLKIRIDSQVLIDSHHARHVADRAEHRAFLAP